MKKIILIHPIPTHYRLPLFNQLSKRLKKKNLLLRVIFCRFKSRLRKNWKINMEEANFTYRLLDDLSIYRDKSIIDIPYSLLKILIQENPDLIICTGFSIPSIMVYIYCKLRRIPFIIWSGAHNIPCPDVNNNVYVNPIRRRIRIMLAKQSCACIAYSKLAENYLYKLGADKQKIFIAINTVDTQFFEFAYNKLYPQISKIEKKYFLSKDNIIYVGDLRRMKGVYYLLKTAAELHKQSFDFYLHMVGDGPEKRELEEFCHENGIQDKVHFWGYKSQEELAQFFAFSDLLIFPSLDDRWGLVLNEAMASGLPVIASKYAGATYDLVQDGGNGFIIDPKNIQEMTQKILILLKDEKLRKKMGRNASKRIKEIATIEKSAEGFLQAIEYALTHSTR